MENGLPFPAHLLNDIKNGRWDKPNAATGSPAATVPAAVLLADKFVERFQAYSVPHACGSRENQIMRRDVGAEELMAFGSACDLLRDYFDRHNPRLAIQRIMANVVATEVDSSQTAATG